MPNSLTVCLKLLFSPALCVAHSISLSITQKPLKADWTSEHDLLNWCDRSHIAICIRNKPMHSKQHLLDPYRSYLTNECTFQKDQQKYTHTHTTTVWPIFADIIMNVVCMGWPLEATFFEMPNNTTNSLLNTSVEWTNDKKTALNKIKKMFTRY